MADSRRRKKRRERNPYSKNTKSSVINIRSNDLVFPTEKDMWLYFKNYEKMHYVPFVVYADFESFIVPIEHAEPNPEKSFTVQCQKHVPCGFCYTILIV